MTPEELQSKLEQWQKRLRLSDWDVTVQMVSALDMNHTSCWGQVRWDLNEKFADIKLVTPEDAGKQGGMRSYDVEVTLVHELLHLHFAPLADMDSIDGTAQEFAINAIAGALVKLAREQQSHAASE